MAPVTTPAIILGALRYGETSKIVRLATRDLGIRSALAKGALRPRSRFGASLQLLSEGVAHLYLKDTRDLQTLAAFDLTHLRAGLAEDLPRFAAAAALGEVAWRFSPAEGHPDSFDLLSGGLSVLETAPTEAIEVLGLRLLWRLVSVLGFAPALARCARDGAPLPEGEPLRFSAAEGGGLCARCAVGQQVTTLSAQDRADLEALVSAAADLPTLDERHAASHRRLFGRFLRHHLAEGGAMPAITFWEDRPWVAA
ncbi:MAG TPA: DNA repair protein RecO [Gemmatimonadales bacterium]|nr:DNA repair protein RecO [Gemmatimonadales bacterium]